MEKFSSALRHAETGSFGPYEIPVLIRIDLLSYSRENGLPDLDSAIPEIAVGLGRNIFSHRFKNFKYIIARKRKFYTKFRGFPAVCVNCPYRVNLAPVFTINVKDPRFCSVENWKIIPPQKEPKYPVHTCTSDIRGVVTLSDLPLFN